LRLRRGCDDGQIGRRHADAEVHAPAARQGTQDVGRAGEVGDDDLGAGPLRGIDTLVVPSDQRPDRLGPR
jgi:hypothetical protein